MVSFFRPCVRSFAPLVAAALLVPVLTTAGATAPAEATTAAASSLAQRQDQFADRILVLVNKRRAKHGLSPVRANPCVRGFADDWAGHLVRENALEHSRLGQLLRRCDTRYASENIGKLPDGMGPRRLVNLWMHSADHRRNILSRQPTATGVSVRWNPDQNAWVAVQNFARKPGNAG